MKYAKAIVAVVAAIAIAGEAVLNGGPVTTPEVEAIITAIGAAVAVFLVPNKGN